MFRPCIDLHQGKVKQIVGGSLTGNASDLRTNFETDRPAAWYARLYRDDQLAGGHIIMLGPGNDAAVRAALAAYPGGLQAGGGITPHNALDFIEAGASHVIVTSWIFPGGSLDFDRLRQLSARIGKGRLVLDLSCRRRDDAYWIVTERWQRWTDSRMDATTLAALAPFCAEFLVHGVDVEGLKLGVDLELVSLLGEFAPLPVTYAGGAKDLADLEKVTQAGRNRVDLSIGSALDIFGGTQIRYADAVAFNRRMTIGL